MSDLIKRTKRTLPVLDRENEATTLDRTSKQTGMVEAAPTKGAEPPVDWEKAFKALVTLSTTGFISSEAVNRWVQHIHDHVDPRAAKVMIDTFNKTRSSWMQGFMG